MSSEKSLKKEKDFLLKLFSELKTESEIFDFLSAVLTPSELNNLRERMEIIRGILEKKSQRQIAKETGASLATISRGSREIQFGSGILQKIFSRVL